MASAQSTKKTVQPLGTLEAEITITTGDPVAGEGHTLQLPVTARSRMLLRLDSEPEAEPLEVRGLIDADGRIHRFN